MGRAWALWFSGIWGRKKQEREKDRGFGLPSLLLHPHALARVLPRTVDRDKFFLTVVSRGLAHMCPVHVR